MTETKGKPKKGVRHSGFDHDGVDTYTCLACERDFYSSAGELDYNLCPYCGQDLRPHAEAVEKAKKRHELRDEAENRGSNRFSFWALQLRQRGEDWDRWLDPCTTKGGRPSSARGARAKFKRACAEAEEQRARWLAGRVREYERVNDGVRLVYGSGPKDYKVAKEFTLPTLD